MFDLLTLKVVSESRVTWAVPILVFLCFSVLDLGPMYATNRRQTDVIRQTDVRQHHRLMTPPIRVGHNNKNVQVVPNCWVTHTYSGLPEAKA